MNSKAFYLSKTFWVNMLAVIVMAVQTETGFVISPEEQIAGLAIINLILRICTKSKIDWGKNSGGTAASLVLFSAASFLFFSTVGCTPSRLAVSIDENLCVKGEIEWDLAEKSGVVLPREQKLCGGDISAKITELEKQYNAQIKSVRILPLN